LEPTGLISALFGCSTRFEVVGWRRWFPAPAQRLNPTVRRLKHNGEQWVKTKQFFSLVLQEVYGVSDAEVNKHFREFEKSRRQFPQIAESLEKDVVDPTGKILQDTDIALLINELKLNADSTTLFRGMVLYGVRFLNLYLQEIETQLQFASRCYDNYLLAKEGEKVEDIFFHIHHFVIHTSNVDKLLDKILNSFQGIVGHLLKHSVDLTGIDFKSFRTLRNHLEHFEERLDAWFYLYAGGPILDMNLATSETKGLPEERCLRLLRTDENVFIVLGERFDLAHLYSQVCLLAQRLSDFSDSKAA